MPLSGFLNIVDNTARTGQGCAKLATSHSCNGFCFEGNRVFGHYDIQPFMDLTAEWKGMQIAAEERSLARLAQFGEHSVGRVLDIITSEAP